MGLDLLHIGPIHLKDGRVAHPIGSGDAEWLARLVLALQDDVEHR